MHVGEPLLDEMRQRKAVHRAGQIDVGEHQRHAAAHAVEHAERGLRAVALDHAHIALLEQEDHQLALQHIVLDHQCDRFEGCRLSHHWLRQMSN